MSTTAIQSEAKTMAASDYISWETFQEKYLVLEDGYKYEWLNGKVEKTPRSMDKKQLYIYRNLLFYFKKLEIKSKVSGYLMAEPDLLFLKNHRRPDVCWLTDEQIDRLAADEYEVPAFIIEVISTNDMMNRVVAKMGDYRAAGVEVVWHILPEYEQVHVYFGDNLDQMKVCSGDMTCSADPALPEFDITVKAIFEKVAQKK